MKIMVVVSGDWVQNVSYPGAGDVIGTTNMAARAVFICRPNSHPFHERSLILDQPVKIGRSVARARSSPNNAIFDCEVLSRNHALLWFENGKFFLQDTKSSNGTFINNQRLSKGSEESAPREVFSGDVVQFGVEVMENSRKVTHGCIIATMRLFFPDGKEATGSTSTTFVSTVGSVPLDELYQLNHYLQDSLQREKLLESKLMILQNLVENTRQASDVGWKALLEKDGLYSRVEILETQLQTYTKSFGEDKLREELRKVQEDKNQYQGVAKKSLRKVLQEKINAVQKLNDLDRKLKDTEDECTYLKELKEQTENDIRDLAMKYSQQLQRVEELSRKLLDSEQQKRESCERLENEKRELILRLEEQINTERILRTHIDTLTTQITSESSCSYEFSGGKLENVSRKRTHSAAVQEKLESEYITQESMKEELESLREQLKKTEQELKDGHSRVDELHLRLKQSRTQEDSSVELTQRLEERLHDLETQLGSILADNMKTQTDFPISNQVVLLQTDIAKLELLLSEARSKKRDAEKQIDQVQCELNHAKEKVSKSLEEANQLRIQLQTAQTLMEEESARVLRLEEQVQHLMATSSELKIQLLETEERLQAEMTKAEESAAVAEGLHKELVDAKKSIKQSHNEAAQLRDKLALLEGGSDRLIYDQLRLRCSSLQEEAAQLKLGHIQLLQRTSELTGSSGTFNEESGRSEENDERALLKYVEQVRDKYSEAERDMKALEETLAVIKERYKICNDEKSQIATELSALRERSLKLGQQQYIAVPVHFIVAVAVISAIVALIIQYFINVSMI